MRDAFKYGPDAACKHSTDDALNEPWQQQERERGKPSENVDEDKDRQHERKSAHHEKKMGKDARDLKDRSFKPLAQHARVALLKGVGADERERFAQFRGGTQFADCCLPLVRCVDVSGIE